MGHHYHVCSVSGGKDSTCTALLMREREDPALCRYVFANTGNEHHLTLEYLDYLETALGITIHRLEADFSDRIAQKRVFVAQHWPGKGVPDHVVERALKALRPRGNPYLDLCIWKGRFPSRRAQFCTQMLKTEPLVEYQLEIVEGGDGRNLVWCWQGVRAAESENRKRAPLWDSPGGGIVNYRPIIRGWTVDDVFAVHRRHGIRPNPLYTMGMTRVGCMPCINCSKDELAEINKRFPEYIDMKAEWEAIVGEVSKRGISSFFPAPEDGRAELRGRDIRTYVEWAQTGRGGRTFDLFKRHEEPAACASAYGLCE